MTDRHESEEPPPAGGIDATHDEDVDVLPGVLPGADRADPESDADATTDDADASEALKPDGSAPLP